MIEINYDAALSAINDAVAAKGVDFVYQMVTPAPYDEDAEGETELICEYLHRNEEGDFVLPGCLVGDAMLRLGVPMEAIQVVVGLGMSARAFIDYMVGERKAISITEKATDLFILAQSEQDGCTKPWSEVVVSVAGRIHAAKWTQNERRIW